MVATAERTRWADVRLVETSTLQITAKHLPRASDVPLGNTDARHVTLTEPARQDTGGGSTRAGVV